MTGDGDARIFFALWPSEPVRAALDRSRSGMRIERPARAVPARNLHLTLHFVGDVSRDAMHCMQQRARAVSGTAFELNIDCSGWFSRPRVGWLGTSHTPAPLAALHESLGVALGDCGFRAEMRPFRAHVTVARKLRGAPSGFSIEPVRWPVGQFALIESVAVENGVEYRPVESYPLT